MLDTLFGLIPAASRGQQWVAEDLQLVNWGGYDGAHRVRFAPTATLLCGGSGSGKSTLMDAYVALMMPHTTPFNGASNGAVTGRARGAEQRNILSYGRGKLDESRTEDGTKVRVLRGDGTDTWTAIAMTWADHDGSRFTAVRAWYIPAGARIIEDTVRVRGTVHGAFDLGALERAAVQHLADSSVRAAGLDTVATDREFSARLHTVLGIGASGAGAKAMSLLARIQAGQQITTVDDLYKRMVLEEPETLATAEAVVEHFDGLEGTRGRMVTARQQVRHLSPIRSSRERIIESAERLRLIDALGRFDAPDSLATLWRAQRRLELLREVETELGDGKRATEQLLRERHALADAADAEREGLVEVLRSAGGDQVATAERELRVLERRHIEVRRERERLDAALAAVGVEARTAEAFAALAEQARTALRDGGGKESAREAYAAASSTRSERRSAVERIAAERQQAELRRDSIPSALHESRRRLAEAAGLGVEQLPFVGELLEVRAEFEPWREAFNLALGGFARTLLIDAEHLPAFRAAVDAVRTGERLSYEGATTGLPLGGRADERTLPGRLDLADSPFAGWLRERLERQFAFVCVDRPAELSQHAKALTIVGQVANGSRGSHGGHGRGNLLGFSNARRLAELDRELFRARAEFADATEAAERAGADLDAHDARRSAYERMQELTWEQVDVAAVEAEQLRWSTLIEELTAGDSRIAELKAQMQELAVKARGLREQVGSARAELERIEQRWGDVIDEVDEAQSAVDAAELAERALDPAQRAYLDERFDAPSGRSERSGADRLRRFDAALDSASRRLAEEQLEAQQTLVEQREGLRTVLATFLDRWPNPNLLPDPDASLGDFERILDELETSGLHELEGEWRDSLLTLSGNDLANLDSAIARSLREIRERIEPINRIMRDLPFTDGEHRLQITLRENQSEVRARFRRELRGVRGAIEEASSEAEREAVYQRMAKVIGRLRRGAPDHAELVDVRNHVRVSAERVLAANGEHVALYDHIGEKSGGESQELIAFIVGAALRYQLGDAGAERPRYAPVFLDEALIKADAHFTQRAIGAWRGLGFQLVIGAPNDKYSAIEPHVDAEYDILKDTAGRSWAKAKVALPA